MGIEVRIKYDENYFQNIHAVTKEQVPKTLRLFSALFERRVKAEARKKTKGGNFWRSIANSVISETNANTAIVGATHVAASHKHTGGIISAPGKGAGSRGAKYLSIPINEESKGKNIGDFPKKDILFLTSRKGNKIVFKKLKDGKIKPLYVLKKSVRQKAETWFPFPESLTDLKTAINETIKV